MGTGGSFPGGKGRQGRAVDHSHQLRADVQNRTPIHPRPRYVFRGVVLDQFKRGDILDVADM
jgi:hypothetical protein